MKSLIRLLALIVGVVFISVPSTKLLAQQAQPLFTERFANVFDPESQTYFSLQGTEGKQFGGQQPYAGVGAFHHRGSIFEEVTLYSGQFMMNYNGITGNPNGTLGAQQRWMTQLPYANRSILGVGAYVDFTQSRYDNLFQQINLNFELYTESAWFGRGNLYLPIGPNQQYTGLQSSTTGTGGGLTLQGTTVGTGGIDRQWMDVALMGSELEIGRKIHNYRAEVYAGYYNWNGPLAGFTNGVKGGLRGYITNNLSGNVNISHDQFFGTNVYGGLTYFFGGSGGNRPMSFENLMTLPVQRSQQVAIGNYFQEVNTFRPLLPNNDGFVGDPLHVYFVKEGGTGTGTQSDPSNVNAVLAQPDFKDGSVIVLLDANGNITSPITLTGGSQQVIGGGATGTADVDFASVMFAPPGDYVLHLSGLGGRPTLMPSAGNAITLFGNNVIQGFAIDGAGGITNGISGHPGASGTVINDMIIKNVAGTGIVINPSINTSISNTTFNNNGTDIQLDALNSKLTNITSTGAVNGSISLGVGGNIFGTTDITNVSITGAGGFGGILLINTINGATVNLQNVTVDGGTGPGVTITNSQGGSIYNLTSVSILNVGDSGLVVKDSAGTINGTNLLSITAVGGSGIDISNSAGLTTSLQSVAISSIGSAPTNNGVTLSDAGTFSILGGTIDGTAGDGIHSVDTNLTVTGTTIGGDGTISGDGIEVLSNSAATRTINLSNNTITGSGSAISTVDNGNSGSLLLTLDGNTLQSLNGGSQALSIKGGGLNSTIIQSMNGGTVIGGTGGGVLFDQVTFDASGIQLLGTQVNAGNWIIGTPAVRVTGDGLRLNAPTGDLKYGTLDIANNNGTGLYVDTKGLGTTFALSNTSGSVDTTNGSALFLDPLSVNIHFNTVSSTGSLTDGATLDTVSGTVLIDQLNVSSASQNGLFINNSSGLTTTITSMTINGVGSNLTHAGVLLTDAGTVNLNGGTIDSSTGDGIHSSDTNLSATSLTIGGVGSIAGDGIEIVNNGGLHTVSLTSNTITGAASGISTKDSGLNVGELLLTLDNNTLSSLGAGSKAMEIQGNGFNTTIIQSMNGGTVLGNGTGGGVVFNRVTFDHSGRSLLSQQAVGGNWTIGTAASRVVGDGLRFVDPTGDLRYGQINIANNNGTGLYVNTKGLGTSFSLSNTSGSINTANGSALFLDPLATDLTFGTVNSIGSDTHGIDLVGVTGSVTVNGGTVHNGAQGQAAINVDNSALPGNSDLTLNLNSVTIHGPTGSPAFSLNGQPAPVPISLNLIGITVNGGTWNSNDAIQSTNTTD